MTIAVGMLCCDGIVLGADREMTLATLAYDDTKAHVLKRQSLQIGIVGAGIGDLIRYAAQALDRRITDGQTAEDVRLALEDVANEICDRIDDNKDWHTNLLVGVKTDTELRLIKVFGRFATVVDGVETIGAGQEIARFVLDGLYRKAATTSCERGIFLTIKALLAAKDYVPGCGGRSDVLVLQRGFHVREVPEETLADHERNAAEFDRIMNPVLLALTDVDVSPQQLAESIDRMRVALTTFRSPQFLERLRARATEQRQPLSVQIADAVAALEGHTFQATVVSRSPAPPEEEAK
jgi:20S proteasome alpha/beta subunit